MRRKLNSEAGVTLVEMLAAVAILILLGLMLNTGMQMAMNTYWSIVAQNEVELLLSSAVDALVDDLRYARDVDGTEDAFTYTSDSFGKNTRLKLVDDRIMAESDTSQEDLTKYPDGYQVLATGAYGYGKGAAHMSYQICRAVDTEPFLQYKTNGDEITFIIQIKAVAVDNKNICAQTPDGGVTVRCLNPKKDTTGGTI